MAEQDAFAKGRPLEVQSNPVPGLPFEHRVVMVFEDRYRVLPLHQDAFDVPRPVFLIGPRNHKTTAAGSSHSATFVTSTRVKRLRVSGWSKFASIRRSTRSTSQRATKSRQSRQSRQIVPIVPNRARCDARTPVVQNQSPLNCRQRRVAYVSARPFPVLPRRLHRRSWTSRPRCRPSNPRRFAPRRSATSASN